MIARDGTIKLIDFGFADYDSQGIVLQQQGLSVGYSSPEWTDRDIVTTASDIFSIGACLFYITTGKHPFMGGSDEEILHRVVWEKAPSARTLNPLIPTKLERSIEACLEKEPCNRPTATELQNELKGLQEVPSEKVLEVVGRAVRHRMAKAMRH